MLEVNRVEAVFSLPVLVVRRCTLTSLPVRSAWGQRLAFCRTRPWLPFLFDACVRAWHTLRPTLIWGVIDERWGVGREELTSSLPLLVSLMVLLLVCATSIHDTDLSAWRRRAWLILFVPWLFERPAQCALPQ